MARPELIDLLRSAELLLVETGDAVALCPVYGDPALAVGSTTTTATATTAAAPTAGGSVGVSGGVA